MKKKLAGVTLFLATALVATGCDSNEVTYKENDEGKSIIFSIKNGSEVIEYTADDLLVDLQDSATAQTKLYSEVSRQVFTQYAESTLGSKVDSIRESAAEDVEDFKDDCQSSAKEEGTDYDTYLETALEGKGVETLEELEALFYYEGLKEEVLDDFIEENPDHYNYFLQKYLDVYTPFQVKHVLVAANTADTKYKDGTMTADNARKLLNVLNRFLSGDTFDAVAELTDDTSSKDNGGIMPFNQAQNYVSEFRFATYAQEIFAKHETLDERYQVAADLHIINSDEESKDYVSKEEFEDSNLYSIYEKGISSIKISDILKLNEKVDSNMAGAYNYFKEDGSEKGNEVPTIAEQPYEMNVNKYNDEGELNEKYYEEYELQRNQIFNRTLNSHKVQYIELDGEHANTTNSVKIEVYDATQDKLVEKTVLADGQNGNPIFFALASTGIHFMSMVWNTYDPQSVSMSNEALSSLAEIICDNEEIEVTDETKYLEEAMKLTNFDELLNEAYFTLYDSSDKDLSKYQYTYIGQNGAYKSKNTLSDNSDALLKDISGYASYLEYYVFDAIVYSNNTELVGDASYAVTFYDTTLAEEIKEFVQDRLTGTDESFASSVQSAAETYGSKLAREAEVKEALGNWEFQSK